MHHYFLPTYRTPEKIYALRRSSIEHSQAYNVDWALKEFDNNPDIEFDFWTAGDIYKLLGIPVLDAVKNASEGWLVIHGNKPKIDIDGMTLETFQEKYRKLLDRIIIDNKVDIIK